MKKILSLALALSLCFSLSVPAFAASGKINFTDVASNAYYADAVTWAISEGITTGTSATTFSPNATCTKSQILTFLWRANGSPASTISNPFSDVSAGAYYADAATWSYEKGLVSGSAFNGDTSATRAATVTYLWKLAGSPSASAANFTDVPNNANYAQAVAWAVAEGITSGTGTATFSPNATCTRGQIVTFLYRDLADPSSKGQGFEYYGLEPMAKLDVEYPFTTACSDDKSKTTTGTVRFTNYSRKSLGNGYDEICISLDYTFSDTAAATYGYTAYAGSMDYYLFSDDLGVKEDIYADVAINWNGKTYTDCSESFYVGMNGWIVDHGTVWIDVVAQVPTGYDGYVVAAYAILGDNSVPDSVKSLGSENLVMFRCI